LRCPGCNELLSELFDDEHGIQHCSCGYERSVTSKGYNASTISINESINPRTSKNDTEDRENFIKALNQYDGSDRGNLPPDLYSKLDRYFIQLGYPSSADIRAGVAHSKPMSYRIMYDALTALSLVQPPYAYVTRICHDVWGWPLPDISHIRELVLDHFELTQRAGVDLSLEPITMQYRLFKHLQMVDHECKAEDFRIPKTREILEKNEHNWKQRCAATGDYGRIRGIVFIPTI
jgi:hypothetical protein